MGASRRRPAVPADVQARGVRVLPEDFPDQPLGTVADDGAAEFPGGGIPEPRPAVRRGRTNIVIKRPCSRAPVSYICWNSGRRRIGAGSKAVIHGVGGA